MATFSRIVDSNVNTGPGTFTVPANLGQYYHTNQSRIPRGAELEGMSSDAIAGLLDPPDMFPDTNRRAAEVTAGRGIGGSAAAYGTGLRMTDEERLRRIALGEQLLTGAYGRQPAVGPEWFGITPYQQAQLNQQNRLYDLREAELLAARGGGGGGGGGGHPPAGIGLGARGPGVMNVPWDASVSPQDLGFANWYGSRPGEPEAQYLPGYNYPNPSGALLPLYPGGAPVGSGGGGGNDYIPGLADYSGYEGIAGLENIGGGAGDFQGLLDYYTGE